MNTKDEVMQAISDVAHPAIDNSLVNLGIVKDLFVEDGTAFVTFAFPVANIPIEDRLVRSIHDPIQDMGMKFQYKIVIMSDDERSRFMQLEQAGWKGMPQ